MTTQLLTERKPLTLIEIQKLRKELLKNGAENMLHNRIKGAANSPDQAPVAESHIIWIMKERNLTKDNVADMFPEEPEVVEFVNQLELEA